MVVSVSNSETKQSVTPKNRKFRYLLGATALIVVCGLSPANSQNAAPSGIVQVQGATSSGASRNFDIPAQPLASALNAFGRQSGLQVTLSAATSRGVTSSAVQGIFTPEQALAQLLRNTGIDFRVTADRTAVIGNSQIDRSAIPAGSEMLDAVDVTAQGRAGARGYQGTPDRVYETPAAVSVISREAIESSPSRNARDLLDNVAGVYANRSEAQNPGISVNIRGLQDQDRVVTMIDGARQSFQRNAHGSSQRTYVDTAFVREIDIEKSSTSGVGSLGSLGGSVNFRTIEAGDLIAPGKTFGGQVNLTTGTNKFNFDGSVSAATRISDSFSILAGVSYKDIGAYDIGKNGNLDLGATYSGDVLLFSGQKVFSTILKTEAQVTDDVKVTLGWVRNDSKFNTGNYDFIVGNGELQRSNEGVVNNTYTSAIDWKPDGGVIDLKARLYYNHIKNNRDHDGSFLVSGPSNYRMATLGGSLSNTSRFETALGALAFNYGLEAFRDDGKTLLTNYVVGGVDYSGTLSGGTPSGKRDVAGGFASATLKHDNWLTVSGGLRYDWYRINGNTTIYGNTITPITVITGPPTCLPSPPFPPGTCFPGSTTIVPGTPYTERFNVNVDRSGGSLLPTFTIAVNPTDWLQPFVKYSESYRPPTIMESFLNGGHDGSSINGYAPNPNLRPERGDTYEVGANILRNGIFSDRDSFRGKVVGFYREIEDYISLGQIRNDQAARTYDTYINLDGITRMKGIEIEANYDARYFYIGGTVTRIDTDFADSYRTPAGRLRPINSGLGASIIFVQPKLRVTVDGGVRLLEEKLTLGGRVTDVSETEPGLGSLRTGYRMPGYTIYDLYGSYAVTDMTKLRFAINNLTDIAYAPALGANFYAAPGRTATVSLNHKF